MIIIRMTGGLGNQMFQYAYYKVLCMRGFDVKIDLSDYDEHKVHNEYELEKVFGISIKEATDKEAIDNGRSDKKIFNKIKRKIKRILNLVYIYYEKDCDATRYMPELLNPPKNSYLFGYWASYKYFQEFNQELKKDFNFRHTLDDVNLKYKQDIIKCNAVSIHIRRGDYLMLNNLQNICTLEYYKEAIKYIKNNVDNPIFYVFSNDINWCKENLKISKVVFIDNNSGINSYKDMELMSYCKHNIIANSSFSFWGAWLNNYPNKIVICPKKFNNDNSAGNYVFPVEWIRI